MVPYPPKTVDELIERQHSLKFDLQKLMVECIQHGQALPESSAREHMIRGAGRRLGVLVHSTENIFSLFPLTTTKPLDRDAVADIQVYLHAFLMNLYGVFENWGWAFVLRHDLEASVGGRMGIGLFNRKTQKFLPPALRDYLTQGPVPEWHEKYLKNYRDALAHRIPPYVPPSEVTPEEGKRFNELEAERVDCLRNHDFERLDRVDAEQAEIGRPSWTFMHAFSEVEPPRPLLLHGQLLTDSMGVVECGRLFMTHWHEVATQPT